jgi:cellulose synthase operon protein C
MSPPRSRPEETRTLPKLNLFRSAALIALLAGGVILLAPAGFAATEEPPRPSSDQKPLDQNDLRRQEIELRNAVRANPNDPAAHVKLAQHYLTVRNFPAAEAEAREARRVGGDEDETAPILAEALIAQSKMTQLIEQIKPADRAPNAESTVRLSLGLAHLGLREIKDAEPLLRDAVRLDSDSWRAKLGLARLLLLKREMAGAAEQIDGARAIAPDNIEVMRLSGEILRSKGDIDGAVADFSKIIAAHPNDIAALVSRANAFLSQNKLTEAGQDVASALKLAPKSSSAIYLNALILARQGKLAEADSKLQSISNAFDALPNGYYLAGAIKYALGQYEQADSNLAKFMARQPNQAGVRRLRAQIALRRNDSAKAIELLKPVLKADPADQASAAVLARAYAAAGKNDEALQLFERAAEAQPENVRAQTAAAVMRMSYGNATEGMAELEKITASAQGADVAAPLLVLADLRRGDVAKAAATTEALAQRSPDDPVIQNLLGSVRIAQQRLPDAEAIFRGLTQKNPDFLAARRNLIQVLVAENRPDDAKGLLRELVHKNPSDARSLVMLAQIDAGQKQFDEAADYLRQAQKVAPKDPGPGVRLVQLYAGRKDWAKAGEALRGLEASFGTDPGVIELSAGLRADQGDLAGAVAKYRALVDRFPKSAPVFARYALLQSRAGDSDGARASLAKAVSLAPHDTMLMQELVNFDLAKKGPDTALATAKSFAKDEPQLSQLLAADVLVRANRADEAIALLTQAQKERPSSVAAARLATLLYKAGKRDEAKAGLRSWIKDHDDDAGGRIALADILMQEHDDGGAQTLYEQAHQKAPNDVVALNNLALLYAKKKDPRGATLAAAAYRLAPRPEIADTLGWSLVSTGKAGEALPYLRAAGAALPQNGSIQYHLAVALDATGSKGEARTLLEKVMKSDGSFDDKADAQRLLDALRRG